MAKTAIKPGVAFVLAGMFIMTVIGGCARPVKDKAHDLGNAFSGNYDAVVNAKSGEVVTAARLAVDDLHLIKISEHKETDESTAIVIARSPEDEKVTVTVLPQGDMTRFTVTTGVFGNSSLRQQVMDAIKLRLGGAALHPATQPATTTQL